MGGCFSGDVRGGKEAVGGGGASRGQAAAAQGQGGANEAVDHFFQGHAMRGLYTPLEVSSLHSSPRESPLALATRGRYSLSGRD